MFNNIFLLLFPLGNERVPVVENIIVIDDPEISKETKKENEAVRNADTQEMETDEKKVEVSLVNLTEKQDGKQPSPSTVVTNKPSPSTVIPNKPAKRRITPMAID